MTGRGKGGWVYIMSNRYRGTLYTGVTANLPARVALHRAGKGSRFCAEHGLVRLVWAEHGERVEDCIVHEKRVKHWHRDWKIALVERTNPDWLDLFDGLAGVD